MKQKKKQKGDETTERELHIRIASRPLPDGTNGVLWRTDENSYTVCIDSSQDEDGQAAAFLHECLHLWHGDMEDPARDVDEIERERHAELLRILERMAKERV